MATLARLNVILGLTSREFARGIDNAQRKLNKFGRSAERTGRQMTTALTVPIALAGAAAVKMSLDFDTAMTKIVSLVGVAEEQVNEWREQLLTLGPTLGKTPTELANALFAITSAGFRGAEAMDVLTQSARASNIGLGDTLTVADAVTSAVTAYGKENLSAAQATAILWGAVQKGKAEADSIAPVLGTVVGVAAEMGVQFHEVAAAIAAMTLVGTPAEVTVTQLSAILSTIQKGAPNTRKGLEDVGTSLEEVRKTLREKGLIDLLTDLKDRFGDNEDAAAGVFGNVRALRGLFALVGKSAEQNVQIFAELADVTENDLGKAADYVATRPGFRLAQVFAQIQASAIALGNVILPILVPAVQKIGEWIRIATERFNALDPAIKKGIIYLAALAAAAGPVLIVIGLIAQGIAALSVGMIAWIAKLGIGAVLIAKNWDVIKKGLAALIDFATPALESFKDFAIEIWTKIQDFAVRVWPTIQEITRKAIAKISAFWNEHGETILRVAKNAWLVAKNIITGVLDVILGTIEAFLHVLNGDWPKAWRTVKETSVKAFESIGAVVRAALLRMSAGWYDMAVIAGQAILRILAKIKQLITAWMEIPFINPAAKVIGNAALDAINVAMGGIAAKSIEAKLEAQALNTQADKLLEPYQKAEKQVAAVTTALEKTKTAAEEAATTSVIEITRAGQEIKGTLRGGFGKGFQEGAEDAKQTYRDLQTWIKDNPLRPEIDTEYIQRQFEEAGLAPWTAGTLP